MVRGEESTVGSRRDPACSMAGGDRTGQGPLTDNSLKLPTLGENCRIRDGNAVSLGAQFVPGSQRSGLHVCITLKWGPYEVQPGRKVDTDYCSRKLFSQASIRLLDPKGVPGSRRGGK